MTFSAGTFYKVTDFKIEFISNDRHLSPSFTRFRICAWIEIKTYSTSRKLLFFRANFKTFHFAQSLRPAQILILEILNVFLWLKLSPSLTLNKLKRFETGSLILPI
jgi:hypothetical protein